MFWVSGEKLTREKLLIGRWLSRQEYWLKETRVLARGAAGLLIAMTLPQLKPEGGAQLLIWQASLVCPWSCKSSQDALACFLSSALAKASAILNWKGPRPRPKASVAALLLVPTELTVPQALALCGSPTLKRDCAFTWSLNPWSSVLSVSELCWHIPHPPKK